MHEIANPLLFAAQSPNNVKLINFEKCCHQYEILTQITLLQKNVVAALTAIQQQSQPIDKHRAYLVKQMPNIACSPYIPRVARIFRLWFQTTEISSITDKEW